MLNRLYENLVLGGQGYNWMSGVTSLLHQWGVIILENLYMGAAKYKRQLQINEL